MGCGGVKDGFELVVGGPDVVDDFVVSIVSAIQIFSYMYHCMRKSSMQEVTG
jgi:hypothetical protein